MVNSDGKTSEWSARFISHDTPVSLVVGQVVTVSLRIENNGMAKWLPGGEHPVHIGYKWLDASGARALDFEDRRTGLPSELYPRQQVALGATLVAPRFPGTYKLVWDLIAEGVSWFADAGNPPLTVSASITSVPTDITGWRVESNLNIAQTARAVDGNPMTYWESEGLQAKGQWFRLNLGTPRLIDGIQILSPGKGFPSAYTLHISANGREWTLVTQVDADNQYDVMAVIAPQMVQYVQITLLASAPSMWMISEILVHAATTWTATASHNPKSAGHTIDNRVDTVWSSGEPQSPQMWFQIDLGHPEMVSGLTLTSPGEELPVSYRVAVWNAGANRWQAVAEKLNNADQIDVAFDAIQTQFINVQLLKPGERAWTIQHARVVCEMERWLGPNT